MNATLMICKPACQPRNRCLRIIMAVKRLAILADTPEIHLGNNHFLKLYFC
jgi:hypothetical protein